MNLYLRCSVLMQTESGALPPMVRRSFSSYCDLMGSGLLLEIGSGNITVCRLMPVEEVL